MKRTKFLVGAAVLAAGLTFVSGGAAATTTTVTLTVNSTADSATLCTIASHKSTGTCTLRGAILAANAVQTNNTMFVIKLAAKTYHLSLGQLAVDASTPSSGNVVQIVGKSKTVGKKKHKKTLPASIIAGANDELNPFRVFEIDSPTQMSNVVITHGNSGNGGGIWTDSALSVQNSVVTGNEACAERDLDDHSCQQFGDGGGIYLGGDDTQTPHLSLLNTTVTANVGYFGGGIANENTHHSSIFAQKSHIDKNVACDAFNGDLCIGGGQGGGIYDHGESIHLEDSTVNGNQAGSLAYDNNSDESYGGGLVAFDTAQLVRTSVNYNIAGNYGGGMYAGDHADFVGSTVSHNIADAEGGGVYVDYLLTSKNSSFSNNIAGGTFECTIVDDDHASCKHTTKAITGTCSSLYPGATACEAYDGLGGGIYSDEEYPQLIATTVSGNLAASIAGDTSSGCSGGVGGGIYSDWTLTVTGGSKVTGNTADCGGGIYNEVGESSPYTIDLSGSSLTNNSAIEQGGAVWTSGPGSAWLVGMTISGNKAGGQTGGVWSNALGSVLFGPGNKITKNTGKGSCKNVTWPCS